MHLCTVKTVIWQICSNRPGKNVPQSARLSAGGGVQSLFGQCPNRVRANLTGASLREGVKKNCEKAVRLTAWVEFLENFLTASDLISL